MTHLETLGVTIENAVSTHRFPVEPANLYDPLRYFMTLGGKRIRPALTLMSCNLFDIPNEEGLPAALCIEFFHNFSLIHDDIMDAAPVRRGKPTIHTKWNNDIAILSGDVLFTEASQQLTAYSDERLSPLLKRFNATAKEVCEGQQMDMDFETSALVTEEAYIEMIRLKTSVLLGCALEFGAILGRQPQATCLLLRDFGIRLGIAFQIQDDLLDLYADPEKFGKQVGGDVLSNKKTLLLLTAQRVAEANNDPRVSELLAMPADEQKTATAKQLFEELGAAKQVKETMNSYYQQAMLALDELDAPEEKKKPLYELSAFLMSRDA
ncbi:MAG: geranyl transferase [Candidatus Fluviicola riflensis]|nr:MAG: geranyl transferase [Candidatus Fluviicola riflensis]OGS77440.1 MAG: geranyl transferase [Candidatus Fluviicola riflensis]OGS84020.1 MAG: geranyl transferase [Fluviicola sp. RIFCSPHIGHO2_12_FULL_43_24]OGS84507.1 MAG: geranyl transferase [Fluviicola sp. RIFCSPHIGHO2_01_FULL_43_53]